MLGAISGIACDLEGHLGCCGGAPRVQPLSMSQSTHFPLLSWAGVPGLPQPGPAGLAAAVALRVQGQESPATASAAQHPRAAPWRWWGAPGQAENSIRSARTESLPELRETGTGGPELGPRGTQAREEAGRPLWCHSPSYLSPSVTLRLRGRGLGSGSASPRVYRSAGQGSRLLRPSVASQNSSLDLEAGSCRQPQERPALTVAQGSGPPQP